MSVLTSDQTNFNLVLKQITVPNPTSHKGQNGRVLIIGGSSLFHGAVLWSAETCAHLVDMVHVVSTNENNEIIRNIKTHWQTGMVIPQKDMPQYAQEDDVILIGNGMMRGEAKSQKSKAENITWEDVLKIVDEGVFTRELVYYLISHFPDKQFVLDAGALQMMDPAWLKLLHKKAIITPHQKEFQTLFGIDIIALPFEEKQKVVQQTALTHSCIILLKAVVDIISDGTQTMCVKGGNAGLTKGGTGDILAGLVAGLSAKSNPFASSVSASIILKKTAEELYKSKGLWYTVKDLISIFPSVFYSLTKSI